MKRYLILFMILGLITGQVGTAEAEQGFERSERTVEAPYPEPTKCNVGRGFFVCAVVDAHPTEGVFTAEVKDAHGQPAYVQVFTRGGRRVGTFCGETTEPLHFDAGSSLQFLVEPTPYFWQNWGTDWVGPLDCPYRVATTGTVSVTLSGWTASDAAPPSPTQSPAPDQTAAERSVDFALRRHLRGTGSVVAADASCSSDVPVVVQRKTSDGWLEVASTNTNADGAFAARLTDRFGRYRAVASEVRTPEATCPVARSAAVRHQH